MVFLLFFFRNRFVRLCVGNSRYGDIYTGWFENHLVPWKMLIQCDVELVQLWLCSLEGAKFEIFHLQSAYVWGTPFNSVYGQSVLKIIMNVCLFFEPRGCNSFFFCLKAGLLSLNRNQNQNGEKWLQIRTKLKPKPKWNQNGDNPETRTEIKIILVQQLYLKVEPWFQEPNFVCQFEKLVVRHGSTPERKEVTVELTPPMRSWNKL